jgi:Domain of unknown function (DUF5666)
MRVFLAVLALSSVAGAQVASMTALRPGIGSAQVGPETSASALPDTPPLPKGNATVIGGAIRRLDRVRDQITLHVFGGRDMKILFDGRTQVYRDGQRASLKDLRSGDRVSVETMLDGTAVFARTVRLLTQSPEGEFHGQVQAYNRDTGELTLRDYLSPETLVLHVSAETKVVRDGQNPASSADLSAGALITAKFRPDQGSKGVAREITILASPGSSFVLTGEVGSLDLRSGLLVLVDPRDKKNYEIHFDPALPGTHDLQVGAQATVAAGFDGSQYAATAITVNVPLGR